jgi:aryl-alcohol dehydrogenase-like predicted oxidoreductase
VDGGDDGASARQTRGVLTLTTRVGLGTAPLGSYEGGPLWWGPQDRAVAVATVREAADRGVGWIDTAPFYGWGRAEEIVGEALRGRAERPLLLTKCGTKRGADGRAYEDASPASVRSDVEASVRRLGIDRVDVVQLHDPDPGVPIEDTWGTLADLVGDGLVGAAGLSNHDVTLLDRAQAVAPVAVVQHQYSVLHRAPEEDGVLAWCERHGVPFLAWAPLASGFLTDGFDLRSLHHDDLRRRLRWAGDGASAVESARDALARVAARHEAPSTSVALAWVVHRPGVHAIVGARTPAEAAALATPLPNLDDHDLEVLGVSGRAAG